MRHLTLVVASLAAPLTLPAETLRGIPADVEASLHISYDEAAKSQLHGSMLELQKRMEKVGEEADPAAAKRNRELAERLGLKGNATHLIDLGFRPAKPDPADGADSERFGDIFGVIHLDLRKSSLDAFAKAEGVAPVSVKGVDGWEFGKLGEALAKALGAEESQLGAITSALQDYAVAMPEDGVVILCPVRELAKAVDCWKGKSPSHSQPAQAKAVSVPLAHTQAQANIRRIQEVIDPASLKDDKAGLKDGSLAIGEDAKDLIIQVQAGFVDEAKAKAAAQQLNSSIAIGTLAATESEEDDAETKFYKGEAAAFLGGLSVRQDGADMVIRSTFPLPRAKVLFGKLTEKVEQAVREAAAAKAGTGAADEEMDAPAKAPAATKTTK